MFETIRFDSARKIRDLMGWHLVAFDPYLNHREDAIVTGYEPTDKLCLQRGSSGLVETLDDAPAFAYDLSQLRDSWRSLRIGDVIGVQHGGTVLFFAVALDGYPQIEPPTAFENEPRMYDEVPPTEPHGPQAAGHIGIGWIPEQVKKALTKRGGPISEDDLPADLLHGSCDSCERTGVPCAGSEDGRGVVVMAFCSDCAPRSHAAEAIQRSRFRELPLGDI